MSPKQIKKKASKLKNTSTETDHTAQLHDLEDKSIAQGLQPPYGWLRWLGYLIACWPFFGLLVAIVYYPQPNEETKRYGKYTLILGLISLTITGLHLLIKFILLAIQGAEQGLSSGYY